MIPSDGSLSEANAFHFSFPEPDLAAAAAARARQARLTKPTGSLGRLETLAVQLAAFQGDARPRVRPAAALLFAADHPVTRHGVSPYPSSVTRAMLQNFADGGAAASVLARELRLPLTVIDVGVDHPTNGDDAIHGSDPSSGYDVRVIRDPAAELPAGDLRIEDALDARAFTACVLAGRRAVQALGAPRTLILGEIGIGNTTAAAAVCAALLDAPAADLVGAGSGASGALLDNKRRVVEDALARLRGRVDLREPRAALAVLRRVGGREIAALFGAMAEALARRTIVLIDGFVVTAAALALARLAPAARAGMVFGHRSHERGHARVLAELDAQPLLDLELRLGEGSGALLAFPLLEHACALHDSMATFESARVPDRSVSDP